MQATRAVLVTGADGQLGTALQRLTWPGGWEIVATNRAVLDLCDTRQITEIVASRDWAAIINCAAYTQVDKAEDDRATAWAVNALAPAAFAQACAATGAPLIQLSTDYVFSGDGEGPWAEDAPTAPLNAYGASKRDAELAIQSSGARHAIIRTSWLVSGHGKNFVTTMLRLGQTQESVSVVDDQHGTPTSAADLAQALQTVTLRLANDPHAPTGIFHFSNAGAVSWAGFAEEIFRQSAARGGPSARVVPIGSSAFPALAHRPANSRLSHSAIGAAYAITPRDWQAALGDILDEIIGKTP
ncbi:dTDP-4-dehydrorhamnose reductase [Sphingomonas sp. C3-2]|uniref:dTDP-4-dehydrorhamnose reductase n=1 Tax=Sphingomonas sp. C3-2 TaxID=3062169 RepID=UPI00294AF4BF|nr:dTDP-4-dehydrorhamnose reductase [Sphingomonas sp. C3-2]WOK35143.1 dTDP-4-dehydrorhamnose reductase [Sphingomonas sp. C3-2]